MVVQQDLELGNGLYTETQLNRKMRDERLWWPLLAQDSPSAEFCNFIRGRHLNALMRTAKLGRLERRVFILSVHGASLWQIAGILGISKQRASAVYTVVKRKLRSAADDRYYGLHEVYWQEVRRYVYRRPTHKWGSSSCRSEGRRQSA